MSRLVVFFLMLVASALAIFLALLGLETLDDNILGWFLLVFGVAYPAGGIIHYFIQREPFWKSARGSEITREEKGDRSFWLILPGFLAVFFAPPLEWMYMSAILPRNIWMQICGLVLVLLGLTLLIWARSHIRGLYSGHVEIQVGHRLVASGPYRCIRHPGYAGFLVLVLGVALGYSSLIGLLAIPLLLLPGLIYRMKVEEKLLAEQFGDEYSAYLAKTKRLLPGIW
jgi:protein-S-isoprenylcysteine O-methyltransferase Ste14